MECKLMSIDSSTNATGYAFFINGVLKSYSTCDYSYIKNTQKRIDNMILFICEMIENERPDIVITELTVVNRNAEAQRNLTMILGAIRYKCLELKIEYHSLRPTEWRKLIKNKDEKIPRKREELKKWSINKIKENYNIETHSDDLSDAILIGQGYINSFN